MVDRFNLLWTPGVIDPVYPAYASAHRMIGSLQRQSRFVRYEGGPILHVSDGTILTTGEEVRAALCTRSLSRNSN